MKIVIELDEKEIIESIKEELIEKLKTYLLEEHFERHWDWIDEKMDDIITHSSSINDLVNTALEEAKPELAKAVKNRVIGNF